MSCIGASGMDPSTSAGTDAAQANEVLARKRAEREQAIELLVQQAKQRGESGDRAFWSVVYDFEQAPSTTNRKQLAELGVVVAASETVDDAVLAERINAIVLGLARMHVYLIHTDHLSDRQLYERLDREVLDEEVPDTPAICGAQEWIDLCTGVDDEEAELFGKHYLSAGEGEPLPFDRDRHLPRPPNFVPW